MRNFFCELGGDRKQGGGQREKEAPFLPGISLPSLVQNSRMSTMMLPCQFLTDTFLLFESWPPPQTPTKNPHFTLRRGKWRNRKGQRNWQANLADGNIIGVVRLGRRSLGRAAAAAAVGVGIVTVGLSLPPLPHFCRSQDQSGLGKGGFQSEEQGEGRGRSTQEW